MGLQGRRLPDTPVSSFPIDYDDLQPGDYWLCQTIDGDRLLNVRDHPEDRGFWNPHPRTTMVFDQNLTGLVLGCIDPAGRYGMLSIHTVRLEEDGTVSVRPSDGSSNSILIKGGRTGNPEWHGYIEHGVWNEC